MIKVTEDELGFLWKKLKDNLEYLAYKDSKNSKKNLSEKVVYSPITQETERGMHLIAEIIEDKNRVVKEGINMSGFHTFQIKEEKKEDIILRNKLITSQADLVVSLRKFCQSEGEHDPCLNYKDCYDCAIRKRMEQTKDDLLNNFEGIN